MTEEKSIARKITDTILSAGGALRNVVSSARDIHETVVDYQTKEKTANLLSMLLDAQQQQLSLNDVLLTAKDRIIELEKEKERYEKWESEKLNYMMAKTDAGSIVYKFNSPDSCHGETHYLCANCYDSGKKSVLQPIGSANPYFQSYCPQCKNKLLMDKLPPSPPASLVGPRRRNF